MDIKCVRCGEPWDSYGVSHGDMAPWEADLFRRGAGCPCCKGKPVKQWHPETISDVDNGDGDPIDRIFAYEDAIAGKVPEWKRPENPILWTCEGCGVNVERDLDTNEVIYDLPLKAKGHAWYNSHPYYRGEPTEKPAHVFVENRPVCEFCLDYCADCGTPICDTLDYDDTYDDGNSFPNDDYFGASGLCVDCFSNRASEAEYEREREEVKDRARKGEGATCPNCGSFTEQTNGETGVYLTYLCEVCSRQFDYDDSVEFDE